MLYIESPIYRSSFLSAFLSIHVCIQTTGGLRGIRFKCSPNAFAVLLIEGLYTRLTRNFVAEGLDGSIAVEQRGGDTCDPRGVWTQVSAWNYGIQHDMM